MNAALSELCMRGSDVLHNQSIKTCIVSGDYSTGICTISTFSGSENKVLGLCCFVEESNDITNGIYCADPDMLPTIIFKVGEATCIYIPFGYKTNILYSMLVNPNDSLSSTDTKYLESVLSNLHFI